MMPTKPYWMVAGVCELVAVLLALAYVASDAWFGAGDIAAMIFWSVPFSLFTAAILRNIGRRIAQRGAPARYAVLIATGVSIGVAWFFALATLLWSVIMTFSFPVGLIWIAAAIASALLVAWLQPHDDASSRA